jgi:hypothetical protein
VSACARRDPASAPAESKAARADGKLTAPADTVGPFYVAISSLDVEANERGARIFDELSRKLADEPAVWANLGLARLKLGDVPGAEQALNKAAQLAPKNDAITLLQATVDEDQGQFARAIERLRGVPNPDAAVLYQLAGLLDRTGNQADLAGELAVYDRLLQLVPNNPVASFGRARLLARMQDKALLVAAIDGLEAFRSGWTPATVRQLDAAKAAAAAGNFRAAATSLAFLQNLNLPSPTYQIALASLGASGQVIGRPIRQFLKYETPPIVVARSDTGLNFGVTAIASAGNAPELCVALDLGTKPTPTIASISGEKLMVGEQTLAIAARTKPIQRQSLAVADLNGDYLADLAFADERGVHVWLQDTSGKFAVYEPAESIRAAFQQSAHGVWAVDFDQDGDLDLMIARDGAAPQILRNNGDNTFTAIDALSAFPEIRDLCWADLDGDGVDDIAMRDTQGRVLVSWNNRAGAFSAPEPISDSRAAAIGYGDVLGRGEMGIVVLETSAAIRGITFDREKHTWTTRELAASAVPGAAASAAPAAITIADLDNNGAPDIVVSTGTSSVIWLNEGEGRFTRLTTDAALFTETIADTNADGLLDLIGRDAHGAATAQTRATKRYHWQSIQTRTLGAHADSRINSFGVGGRIEIRAGPLLAVAPITSSRTHFGLGEQTEVGLARIVWPNGVAQVEFSPAADQEVMATQRLKGSCPWVFARNGNHFDFIKDFIWRSPLGMRISSQDTAGVDQTSDWILIPGAALSSDRGEYEIRITADLWETHFFDQVALRVVDHPASSSVFVDERFVPGQVPTLAVIPTAHPASFARVVDQSGHNVASRVAETDGVCVDDFPLARYQGIATDHWVEFDLPADVRGDQPLVIVGTGWIYPTDSSLNVAISQGSIAAPRGLSLEQFDPTHGWQVAADNLGFVAGKNKTVVIPIPHESIASGHRRFRLRTNLEIYWDRLCWAKALPDAELKETTAATRVADLRYRGFSDLGAPVRRKMDAPVYARLAATGQQWQDLEGYYTRFGDVRELLESVDDRYVIMNAGDEMIFRFAAPPPPPAGWVRDFVLVGDGWVKDGDFNTANSRTVLPLPTHADHHYGRSNVTLESDPVFQQHADDWRQFHTRYVSPMPFERGLMQGASGVASVGGTR